ncbi:MAG: flagellin [Planctomycetota bacterium]
MLAIKNNLMAEVAARQLGKSYDALSKSVERLSSGLRINGAQDDAAGLAVRELIRADVAQLDQASRNADDAVSMLQTAEGAMGQIDELLVRMGELAEQAATGSYSSEQRDIMNNEYAELSAEITRIAESTAFNGNELLNSTTDITIHLGSGSVTLTPEVMTAAELGVNTTVATTETHTNTYGVASADDDYVTIDAGSGKDEFHFQFGSEAAVDITSLGDDGAMSLNELVDKINDEAGYAAAFAEYNSEYGTYSLQLQAQNAGAGADLTITDTNNPDRLAAANFTETTDGADGTGNDLTTTSGAESALSAVESAISTKDIYRAKLGYTMNRLEAAQSVLDIQGENLLAAESRISDVDVATEMAAMSRNQVLTQAGVSMLSQANMMPQMALSLLQ